MRLTGTIGERITALRTEQHISQKELADLLYVNQGTVSRWERDIRYPDNDLIVRMAKLFGVSSSVLAVTVADAPVAAVLDGTAAEGRITAGMLRPRLTPKCFRLPAVTSCWPAPGRAGSTRCLRRRSSARRARSRP